MNKKGTVLIISLWVAVVLALLAMGVGQRAAANLKLSRSQLDSFRANMLVESGINKAKIIISYNLTDIKNEEEADREIFDQKLKADNQIIFSCADEESRVNLNPNGKRSLDFEREKIRYLFESKGLPFAQELAGTVSDWTSPVSSIDLAKKENFSLPQEVKTVFEYFYFQKGYLKENAQAQAQEVYLKIKDIITVFGDGKINVNTASKELIGLMAQAAAKVSGSNDSAASSLTVKLLSFLSSNKPNSVGQIILNTTPEESVILDYLNTNVFKTQSRTFRIEALGRCNKAQKKLSVVYDTLVKRNLYWQQD